MKYSAKSIIEFISNPDNGLKIDSGIPRCPKEHDCLDIEGNCSYSTGCHQKILFFREKNEHQHYGYFNLNFTYPLHKQVDGDGYIDEKNGSLADLLKRNVISQNCLIAV